MGGGGRASHFSQSSAINARIWWLNDRAHSLGVGARGPAGRMSAYADFLQRKAQLAGLHGFAPTFQPSWLYDFQANLVEWATRKGRAAIFADCGMGKTPIQLAWAQNVVEQPNQSVLL